MKFKKIMSILASAVMLSSTIGFAAAASYPEPFVSGGTANGAVVVGTNAAVSDWAAAIDVQENLQGLVTTGTSSTDASVTGEAAPLFTSSSKIYVNSTLNAVKSVLTKSDLPTVLKDGSFSGNVDASYTQTIVLGSSPRLTYMKQPTSSDDPNLALEASTSVSNYLYNATVTFNKAIALNHTDSEGEKITLFGKTFTIAAATDTDTLVLLKEAQSLSLDSNNPIAEVTVAGNTYTVELVSSSDTAATIKVTDSSGSSESKEINEAASKKVRGLTIAVNTADETNLKLAASIIVGAEKITIEDASTLTSGEEDTLIDGTQATWTTNLGSLTKITFQVFASESDMDAIKAGESLVDPIFGTFKLDFSGLNIDVESTAREEIAVNNNGDDKMEVKFTNHNDKEATFLFAKNTSASFYLQGTDDGKNISVTERESVYYNEYVVVGNEDTGYLLRLSTIKNASSGYSSDQVKFTDAMDTATTYTATLSGEGTGTLTVGGKVYDLTYHSNNGVHTDASDAMYVRLNYPDSAAGRVILYPTIETSKGASLAFYEPKLAYDMANYDGANTDATHFSFPDGDGYTDYAVAMGNSSNFTVNSLPVDSVNSVAVTVGQLTYNFTYSADNSTNIYLVDPQAKANILDPAIIIFEEKDDASVYNALIVKLETGATSDDGIGVSDVIRTWGADSSNGGRWEATRVSNSKITDEMDRYGALISLDASDSDQTSAAISYPDEQVYAQLYMAEESASITPGSSVSGAGGQVLVVKDSEVSSVSSKNLVVVGGSCINTVAAKILGSETPLCTSAFTEKTGASAGQYIIKTIASPYAAADSGKVAMLVAGYDAADTTNAVTKALEGVTSDVDTSQVYPITTTTTA